MDVPISTTLLFIGPNNSGKSLVLREMDKFLSDFDRRQIRTKLLASLTVEWPSARRFVEQMLAHPEEYQIRDTGEEWQFASQVNPKQNSARCSREELDAIFTGGFAEKTEDIFINRFIRPYTRLSTGRSRFDVLAYTHHAGHGPLIDTDSLIAYLHNRPLCWTE